MIVLDPIHFDADRLSDHAPSFWKVISFGFKEPEAPVVDAPAFQTGLACLCRNGEFNIMDVSGRSIVIKEFIRDAARHARDVLLEILPESPTTLSFVSLALLEALRCLWGVMFFGNWPPCTGLG